MAIDIDNEFRLEWWDGTAWTVSSPHARLTWAQWLELRPRIERNWTTPWRLIGLYLKCSSTTTPPPAAAAADEE